KKGWGLDRVCPGDEAGLLWSCSRQGRLSLIKCNVVCPRAASQFHIGTWETPARKIPLHVNRGLGLPKFTPRPGQWQAAELVDSPVVPTLRIHFAENRKWNEPSLAGMRLGGSLALACCKVAVDACFLSSRIYCAGSGSVSC